MWNRFHKILRCPVCSNSLDLVVFQSSSSQISDEHTAIARRRGLSGRDFNEYVREGVLLCADCKLRFPITKGLPILLCYQTPAHDAFATVFKERLSETKLRSFEFCHGQPASGEQFVLKSFSEEWSDYEYDGVLWEASYEDLEQRFLREINLNPGNTLSSFLEVGCGLGVSTYLAQKNYETDAVGADLSQSVLQASRHYGSNPFLHFVQASVFHLPFERMSFDAVYSRGALHHTFSTCEALKSLSSYCRPGGLLYLWVYGRKSIDDNVFRRLAYSIESVVRPVLSKRPDLFPARAFLACMALSYLAFNKLRRMQDPTVQRYDFKRALHAARDRFTPRYAHRHEPSEVEGWFRDLGFSRVERIDWRGMPSVEQDDYRRNIGISARRPLCAEDEHTEVS
jgi:SAM-dependent methyltransferase/uncharacterized protein YbaR (Trm112 family)